MTQASPRDVRNVVKSAKKHFKLTGDSGPPRLLHSASLCVIGSVYSIGIRYEAVKKVIERYCERYGVTQLRDRDRRLPDRKRQDSISALLDRIDEIGPEEFAASVLENRSRTSPRNGILKAEAVRRFAHVLQCHRVEHLQDVRRMIGNRAVEDEIRAIPGQHSGLTHKYFFMRAGIQDFVKPDRMIRGYLKDVLGWKPSAEESEELIVQAAIALKAEYPQVTPRLLDLRIWEYQRTKSAKNSGNLPAAHCGVRRSRR